MARNEIAWQTKIIAQIRKEGGYGRKWATQWTVGVPDLVLANHHLGTVLVEVKLYKGLKPGWSRQVGYTEKQKDEGTKINRAGGYSFGLVICEYSQYDVSVALVRTPPPGEVTKISVADEVCKWEPRIMNLTSVLEDFRLQMRAERRIDRR